MRRLLFGLPGLVGLAGLVAVAAVVAVALPQDLPAPAPTPRPTGQLRAVVQVTGADRTVSPGADAVVWLPGLKAPAEVAVPRPSMASRNKRFDPRVVAVPVGSSVSFPNFDRIYHNVFSLSAAARFDLGLYRNGASKSMTFDKPGLVRVYCNIHPQMAGYVLVVDGTHLAQAGADGVALLPSVPVGRHPVKVWDEKGGEWSGTADVLPAETARLAVTLDGSAWKEHPHKNKHGKEYPSPDDDENRY